MQRAVLAGSLVLLVCIMPSLAEEAKKEVKNAKPGAAAKERAEPAAKQVAKPEKDAGAKTKDARKAAPAGAADKPNSPKSKSAEKKEAEKKARVVELTLRGSYSEGPSSDSLLGEVQKSLADLIRRIDEAAGDDDVDALVLRIEGTSLGRGKIHEIRQAVKRCRQAGKPVFAQLAMADAGDYLLASACDQIVMVPSGSLIMTGVRAEMTFYKGLFDKLGIHADMMQMGKYKGAAEPYTRSEMSPPLRESMEAVVDDIYDGLAETIAEDRGTEDHRVKTLIDEGVFMANAARRAGLVDQVLYADQLEGALKKHLDADEIDLVTRYRKKKIDTDFSGITGLVKMMNLMFGGDKEKEPTDKEAKIAVVYAVGIIMPGKSTSSIFGDEVLGSTTLVEALQKADKDENVKAIVLRIDSPGGSAVASDLIWRETVRIEKPIVASMGDVAGSGGYYIAMGADTILAEPGTITGSIGVVSGKLALAGLYDKIGLSTEVISRGKVSGLLSSNDPWTAEERAAMTKILREIYGQFVGKAAQGRDMPRGELEKLAQGRIYTGRMAAANGLIDGVGTLADAVSAAKKAAGLKPKDKVKLMVLPKPRTIFEQLFGDAAMGEEMRTAMPGAAEAIGQAATLRRLFAEPTLMLMPFRIHIE